MADKEKGDVMKKIALLFTILCMGQLYGMESLQESLPKDFKDYVAKLLKSPYKLDVVIQNIKGRTRTNRNLNNNTVNSF